MAVAGISPATPSSQTRSSSPGPTPPTPPTPHRNAIGDSPFAAGIDTDHDGVVSTAELAASTLVQAILTPDLPSAQISLGLRIIATR